MTARGETITFKPDTRIAYPTKHGLNEATGEYTGVVTGFSQGYHVVGLPGGWSMYGPKLPTPLSFVRGLYQDADLDPEAGTPPWGRRR